MLPPLRIHEYHMRAKEESFSPEYFSRICSVHTTRSSTPDGKLQERIFQDQYDERHSEEEIKSVSSYGSKEQDHHTPLKSYEDDGSGKISFEIEYYYNHYLTISFY